MKAPDPGFGTRTRGWELTIRTLETVRADPDPVELNEEPPALPAAPPLMPRAKLSWGASKRTTAKTEAQYSLCLARSISAPDIHWRVSSNFRRPLVQRYPFFHLDNSLRCHALSYGSGAPWPWLSNIASYVVHW